MSNEFSTASLSKRVLTQLESKGDLKKWIDEYLQECAGSKKSEKIQDILEEGDCEGGLTKSQLTGLAEEWFEIRETWPDYDMDGLILQHRLLVGF